MSSLVVWRLCAAKYGASAYSGEGAELYGGRWSPPGVRIVYCAESRALAVVEVLVNVDEPSRLFGIEWVVVPAEIPAALVEKPARFPDGWQKYPYPREVQSVGANWMKAASAAVLRVPSAVVPGEFNYLLNPAHPDFPRVKIGRPEPFAFDARFAAKPVRY